jgi:hypothetical protein
MAAGTELHEISGYRPDFRLAAWEDNAWHVYDVDDVPDAETGEDMLDLRNKVTRVHLVEGDRGEAILRTRGRRGSGSGHHAGSAGGSGAARCSNLYDPLTGESPVFVRFDMVDCTAVQRAWHVKSDMLWRRIEAPKILEAELSPLVP